MTNFSINVKAFGKRANQAADKVVRKLCLDIFSDITNNTPVDTGRARANWFASINTPSDLTIEYNGRPASAAKGAIANAGVAISQATGNIFWISNNLPYIYRLEFEGWSKQAPNGMVRLAINRAERRIR